MPREYDYILRVASRFMGMNTLKEDKEQILELDWDVVVYQAILHKMVPILFDDLKKTKLVQCINNTLYYFLRNYVSYIMYLDSNIFELAFEISIRSQLEGIKVFIVKGPILMDYLYGGNNYRVFNDIDLLVEKKNVPKVKKILCELGYVQGHYSKEDNTIRVATRQEIVQKEMGSHETVEFHKSLNGINMMDIVVDINSSFSWKGIPCIDAINMRNVMNHSKKYIVNGCSIDSMEPEYLFLHTCVHLYVEATLFCWQYSWYKNYGDIELSKYIDIGLFLSKKIKWELVNDIILKNFLVEPISYVLTNFSLLFSRNLVPQELVKYIVPEENVNFYFTCNGEKKYWKNPITKRVFDQKLRKKEVFECCKIGEFQYKRV